LLVELKKITIEIMGIKTTGNSNSKTGVRYIVNDKGEKTEVVLPIGLYEKLIDAIEELQDIKDFDDKPCR
jgi:hypothetical protein